MGLKGKDRAILPFAGHAASQGRHPSDEGVTVPHGEGAFSLKARDGLVEGEIGRTEAAVRQQFGAGADRRQEGLDEDLAGRRRRQGFLADLEKTGSCKIEGGAVHFPFQATSARRTTSDPHVSHSMFRRTGGS